MATLVFLPYSDSTTSNVGTLCVKETINSFSTPERHILYWPVGETNRQIASNMFPELDTDKPLQDSGSGIYYFYRGYGTHSPTIRLKDGGQTKPIKTVVEPIAVPKTRKTVPVRYQNGIWQKYLKAEGWVNA